jgi:hypothetical protein
LKESKLNNKQNPITLFTLYSGQSYYVILLALIKQKSTENILFIAKDFGVMFDEQLSGRVDIWNN